MSRDRDRRPLPVTNGDDVPAEVERDLRAAVAERGMMINTTPALLPANQIPLEDLAHVPPDETESREAVLQHRAPQEANRVRDALKKSGAGTTSPIVQSARAAIVRARTADGINHPTPPMTKLESHELMFARIETLAVVSTAVLASRAAVEVKATAPVASAADFRPLRGMSLVPNVDGTPHPWNRTTSCASSALGHPKATHLDGPSEVGNDFQASWIGDDPNFHLMCSQFVSLEKGVGCSHLTFT
jgi:hypothetical protein